MKRYRIYNRCSGLMLPLEFSYSSEAEDAAIAGTKLTGDNYYVVYIDAAVQYGPYVDRF